MIKKYLKNITYSILYFCSIGYPEREEAILEVWKSEKDSP